MAELALALYAVYGFTAFGVRSFVQWRRTGSTGFKGIGGRPGSIEWAAGAGFALAIATGVAAPVLALGGAVAPIGWLDGAFGHAAGVALAAAGIGLTLLAQMAMGDSWRIGVDHSERTALVVHGPFGLVRNPIFSAMIPTALGLALMVPSVVALAGVIALIAALELQVRAVEEPYLQRVHGDDYATYSRSTGRFFPAMGLLP